MAHSPMEKGMDPAADSSALTDGGHYLIRIVRSGFGCLRIGENLYLLYPGTVFIIRPGEVKAVVSLLLFSR